MALSQTDLDNLEKALASGRLTVEYDGQRVTFQSFEELRKRIAYVRNQIAGAPLRRTMISHAEFRRDDGCR